LAGGKGFRVRNWDASIRGDIARGDILWTCDGPLGIEPMERLDKAASIDPLPGIKRDRDQISHDAGCTSYPWLSDMSFVNNRITPMYSDGKFVFFCTKYSYSAALVTFKCSYALLTDVRDMSWRPVSAQRIASATAKATMADVAESGNCPGDYPK
jgi:hypothetical protein